MRVTQRSTNRSYLTNLNRSASSLNESEQKLSSGRAISKMSDDVSVGTRALTTREKLYKNEQYQKNIQTASEQFSMAEGNLTSIKDILNSVQEQTLKALNGTSGEAEYTIFANSFDVLKDQVIQFANCTTNDKYIMGGTNKEAAPFTIGNMGNLLYNGVDVNDIENVDGVYFYNSGNDIVPQSNDIYIDIGLGIKVNNGIVDPKSAFNSSVSGLKSLGCGFTPITYTDSSGNSVSYHAPNNVYEIIDEMSNALKAGDMDKLGALNTQVKKCTENLVLQISDIGIRTNYLDTNLSKLEDENISLTKTSSDLEIVKDTDELVNYKSLEYSWLLTLQFGSKIIPQSLMDYLR